MLLRRPRIFCITPFAYPSFVRMPRLLQLTMAEEMRERMKRRQQAISGNQDKEEQKKATARTEAAAKPANDGGEVNMLSEISKMAQLRKAKPAQPAKPPPARRGSGGMFDPEVRVCLLAFPLFFFAWFALADTLRASLFFLFGVRNRTCLGCSRSLQHRSRRRAPRARMTASGMIEEVMVVTS